MSTDTTVSCYVVGFLLEPASKVSGAAPTVHITRCKDNVRRFITGHLEGAVPATRGRIEKVIGVHHIEFDTGNEEEWCSSMIASIKAAGEWPEPAVMNGAEVESEEPAEAEAETGVEAPRTRRRAAAVGAD